MWQALAKQIIDGHTVSKNEAHALLNAPDSDTLLIVDAAWRVRRQYFGNTVKVNILTNAKASHCSEDCHYCGQANGVSTNEPAVELSSGKALLELARQAKASGASRFCVTMAVRSPSLSAIDSLALAVRTIKEELGLEICMSLGLMTGAQGQEKLKRLRQAGVDSYNHNTHRDLYPEICSTHSYDDRLETIRNARSVGLSVCSGLIVGMGESHDQLVDLAFSLHDEQVNSIPVNFLLPIKDTPLGLASKSSALTPFTCLRYLSLFRLINPQAEIRASAGREMHIRSLQPLALLVANSIFIEGYLTQPGRETQLDLSMIADLGFEVQANT